MSKFTFDRVERAAGRGMDRLMDSVGIEKDVELNNYNSLSTDDFQEITNAFGADATISYIQEMESRKLKRGR